MLYKKGSDILKLKKNDSMGMGKKKQDIGFALYN